MHVGDIVEGTVTGTAKFGAFVRLPNGEEGLVHISQLAHKFVEAVEDEVKVGDTVRVKVLEIKDGKYSLSIKAATAPPRKCQSPEDLERKIQKFLAQSEKRLKETNLF